MLKLKCKRCGAVVMCSPFDPILKDKICPRCIEAIKVLERTGGKNRATRRAEAKRNRGLGK